MDEALINIDTNDFYEQGSFLEIAFVMNDDEPVSLVTTSFKKITLVLTEGASINFKLLNGDNIKLLARKITKEKIEETDQELNELLKN